MKIATCKNRVTGPDIAGKDQEHDIRVYYPDVHIGRLQA